MKRISLAGALAASLLAAPAIAADAPAKAPYFKAAPTGYNWTGWYVGVDGGYLDAQSDFSLSNFADANSSSNPTGFVGGAHIGYRWQAPASRMVFGIEADFWGADADDARRFAAFANEGVVNVNWGGSIRGVVGVTMSPTLLYLTGGAAFLNYEGCTNTGANTACLPGTAFEDTRWGWTVGVGIAHAVTPRLVARLEYLYADYGDETHPTTGLGPTNIDLQTHIVRAGLSWRFGN